MNIFISTLFPNLYNSFFATSIIHRSIENKIFSIDLINMFSIVNAKERIDSPIVGHGAGILLGTKVAEKVYEKVLEKNNDSKPFTIFFSPHGKKLNQRYIKEIYKKIDNRNILLFAGRYEGFDARVEEEYADEIISIGDYVLFGGDLPVMVFLETLLRLIPGVVGNQSSVENDSFNSPFVDHPHYALPDTWHKKTIPSVLKSGNHKEINNWRNEESIKRTVKNHWQWLIKHQIEQPQKNIIKKHIPNHYCVLLHNDIVLKDGTIGESTVTSIDIHDIARSATTYGIKKYYIVTRIIAQQKLVEHFLTFWHSPEAKKMNQSRAFALKDVEVKSELQEVIETITQQEGKGPIIIVTSSRRNIPHDRMIFFHDQDKMWKENRPILFIFGTAHGIDPHLMNNIEYRFIPIEGLEEFNYLSVRSAAAVVFDRWIGCNYCYE